MLKRFVAGAAVAGAGWVAFNRVSSWAAAWGVDPEISVMPLAGDDLVPDPSEVETRSIVIEAPAAAVWPWLVQMGFGRGGWYSYDQLDMKGRSADTILPELQALAVGDIMPTHPAGGFEVRVLDPERALVLYTDTALAAEQANSAAETISPGATPGLAVSGAMLSNGMPPQFAASWAFVLEPVDSERSRLIERFRAALGPATATSRVMGPLMGFGIFVMMRRQMLGLRDRAERVAAQRASSPVADATPFAAAPVP
jgi:hypothetical protein